MSAANTTASGVGWLASQAPSAGVGKPGGGKACAAARWRRRGAHDVVAARRILRVVEELRLAQLRVHQRPAQAGEHEAHLGRRQLHLPLGPIRNRRRGRARGRTGRAGRARGRGGGGAVPGAGAGAFCPATGAAGGGAGGAVGNSWVHKMTTPTLRTIAMRTRFSIL